MPFDGNKLWGIDKVISEKQIIKLISKVYPLSPIIRESGSTANLYSFDKTFIEPKRSDICELD